MIPVTLGCVLAGDPSFGPLLVVYLASLIWCLVLFYQVRQHVMSQSVDPAGEPLFTTAHPMAAVPWSLGGLFRAGRWTTVVIVVGFVVVGRQPLANVVSGNANDRVGAGIVIRGPVEKR